MSKLIGPQKSYCTMLDEALVEAYQKDAKENKYFPLRPSSAGYCTRKLGYDLAAFEGLMQKEIENRKPSVIRLLSLGHGIEYHALRHLQTIPGFSVKFKQQVVSMFRLNSGRLIEGSLDAVMWSEEHKAVLDVKSIGNGWSAGFRSRWDEQIDRYSRMRSCVQFDPNAFYIEDVEAFFEEIGEDQLIANITQVNLYLMTDFLQERGVSHGVIYRYSKVDSQHAEFRFAPSKSLFEKTRKKFQAIEDAVNALRVEGKSTAVDELPRDYVLGSQACAYCPYNTRCYPEMNPLRAHYKTLPKKAWAEKLESLEGGPALREMFGRMAELEKAGEDKEVLEALIIKEILAHDVKKIKLDDGRVFEVKYLQSPKPHYELRKGKE